MPATRQNVHPAQHRGADGFGHALACRRQIRHDACRPAHGGRPQARRARDRHRRCRGDPRVSSAGSPIPGIDVVITTGGTGFTGRDVTPEAIEPLFEKRMDGFSIAFHMLSHAKIGDLDDPEPRHRRRCQARPSSSACRARPAPAATAGTASSRPARLPHAALQLRRDHAAARRASAPAEGEGRVGVAAVSASLRRVKNLSAHAGERRHWAVAVLRPNLCCARRRSSPNEYGWAHPSH